ncbi:type II toxin-antitoxin system HicB family antitoxin [Catenulispora pinisilvae]|uniref:type II toxin-antitoxin system HicB family antitoxin n=1 Tax=Catenulispora pinisilvae TaxID=2705253 RepID=UPI0018926392|nr:type II toxin-antitoxin system HicB family antitoxin [Catenulispora pinisilvae]
MTSPAAPETYRAIAELDGDWWVVTVPDLRGVYTQGRTYEQARAMARDAIATMLGVAADRVAVTMDVRLPGHAEDSIDEVSQARAARDAAAAAEQRTLRESARRLKAAGVKVVDAAALLGISKQRVYQLLTDS